MARITKPLTNTEVQNAKPKAKEYNLADGNGLYLRIKPTGAKTWIFNYYQPTTTKRTNLNLGKFPEISLAQARAKREEYRRLLAQGIDPQTYKAQKAYEEQMRNLNTFQAVAERWRDKKLAEIEEKTVRKYWRSLELHVLPKLGAYPVSEILPTLVIPILKVVENSGALDMVNRLCGYINEILNYAVNSGLIPFNSCLKIANTFKKHRKENNPHIQPEEMPELLSAIANARIEPLTRAVLHFQLLTMTRPSEASQAEWSEIDLNSALWTIPPERMKKRKAHIIPLSTQAVKLLRELQAVTGDSRYIFPMYGNKNRPMSKETANKALHRMGYGGRQTTHGLRGLASTALNEQGELKDYVDACLSHSVGNNVSQAYNHATYLEQRKAIMQQWGDFIEQCSTVKTI